MLFSDKNIASFINKEFEPVWQSLRPAPTVTIDFGDGNTIKRTLNGNIATYVCLADGRVVDVLPGIYEPQKYVRELQKLRIAADDVSNGITPMAQGIREYHAAEAARLRLSLDRAYRPVAYSELETTPRRMDVSKLGIEMPMKRLLRTLPSASEPKAMPHATASLRENLTADSNINEQERRLQIHERLAQAAPNFPSTMNRWLYKEVLHTDLDDPYLGLRPQLGSAFPWQE